MLAIKMDTECIPDGFLWSYIVITGKGISQKTANTEFFKITLSITSMSKELIVTLWII